MSPYSVVLWAFLLACKKSEAEEDFVLPETGHSAFGGVVGREGGGSIRCG
jgi:hypothetical protein